MLDFPFRTGDKVAIRLADSNHENTRHVVSYNKVGITVSGATPGATMFVPWGNVRYIIKEGK